MEIKNKYNYKYQTCFIYYNLYINIFTYTNQKSIQKVNTIIHLLCNDFNKKKKNINLYPI